MRIVVTGGCGFIGRNLLASALERGHQVRALDHLSATGTPDLAEIGPFTLLEGPPSGWEDRIQVVRADVADLAAVERLCAGADAVVHLAASTGIAESLQAPYEHCAANVLGTLAVLETCRRRGIRRCVLASSGAVLGEVEPPMHEALLPNPISPYGASKLAGEALGLAYRASFGLGAVALRFSNVYGPHSGHKSSVVARFITTILDGGALTIYGDGRQTRDFLFVRDLVGGIWAALATDRPPGGVYQIGSGVETSVADLFRRLGDLAESRLGRRPEVRHAGRRPGEVQRNYADIKRAREDLGYAPATPLDRGLEETFDWFLARRHRPAGR